MATVRHGESNDPRDDRGVFLDRDGTINVDRGYTHRVEEFTFLPQAIEGLQILSGAGYRLFVITNQAGIARGYYTVADVEQLHGWLARQLDAAGVHIERFLVCPHHPAFTGPCSCRKPGNALLEEAVAANDLDRQKCWMIGDRGSDQGAAEKSGLHFIGMTGYPAKEFAVNTFIAEDLCAAAQYILTNQF